MNKQHITTAVWITVTASAFGLGWILKPAGQAENGGTGNVSIASETALAAGTSGHRKGSTEKGDEAGSSGKTATPAALTSESITALGKQFREATDPLTRREIFAKLLAGLTAENALEIREQIAGLDPDDPAFRDFHFAWGKVDGLAAVLHGVDTPQRDMGPALAGWVTADPAGAKAWYESLDPKADKPPTREQLKEAYVHGLAIADPAMATNFVMGLGAAGDPRAKQMMSIITEKMLQSGGTAAAAAWATGLPDGDLRGHALYEVARAQARENPAAAAEWATKMAGGKNGESVVYAVSSEWGGRNGPATVQWLDSLGGNQSASYGPAFAGWAKTDPLAASQRVAAMPPSDNRDYAIGGLVYSYRWEDPVSSIAWANTISDAKRRQDVLTMTAESYMRKDPAGATAWLPTSGLPVETQQRLAGGK